jgi:hypothetical protein
MKLERLIISSLDWPVFFGLVSSSDDYDPQFILTSSLDLKVFKPEGLQTPGLPISLLRCGEIFCVAKGEIGRQPASAMRRARA